MSDTTPAKKTTKATKKATPQAATTTIVVGSNIGHARRAAAARGLPRSAAYACDDPAIPELEEGDTLILSRPKADKARYFEDLKANTKATVEDDHDTK